MRLCTVAAFNSEIPIRSASRLRPETLCRILFHNQTKKPRGSVMPTVFQKMGYDPEYSPRDEEGGELFNQGLEAGGEIVDLLLLACNNDPDKARVIFEQWRNDTRFPSDIFNLMNGIIGGCDISLQGAQDGQERMREQER